MQTLTAMIRELETRMQGLLNDLQKIKKQARLLAEENDKLREELARFYGKPLEENPAGEGLKELRDLYNRGFHICHGHFGRTRTGDCLFCEAFWSREREGST